MMYSDDYNQALVPCVVYNEAGPTGWTKTISDYLSSPTKLRCPLDHLDASRFPTGATPTAFGINRYVSSAVGTWDNVTYEGHGIHEILNHWDTIQFTDAAVVLKSTAGLPPASWQEDLQAAPGTDLYSMALPANAWTGASEPAWSGGDAAGRIIRPFARHGGMVNAVFYDGHSEAVPAWQFDPAETPYGSRACRWDNVAPGEDPFTMAEVARAMRIASGGSVALVEDIERLNVIKSGDSTYRIDQIDVVRLARKAAGMEENP